MSPAAFHRAAVADPIDFSVDTNASSVAYHLVHKLHHVDAAARKAEGSERVVVADGNGAARSTHRQDGRTQGTIVPWNESRVVPFSVTMRIQSFALVPDLGVTRFVCTYCARSLGRADIVDTPLFADGWFGGEPQFEAQRARARVPGCLDCATELARLQERLQAAYDDGAATTPLDVQRWMDRLVRALHRVELRALLPRHARIDGGVVSDHHDVARLDSELEFEYRLPAPGLAYWFASPIERGGGSIWFVSIRRRVLLSAVVPAL